jgi:hypothetical protein
MSEFDYNLSRTYGIDSLNHRAEWLERFIKEHKLTYGAEVGVYKGKTFKHLIENCDNLFMIGVDIWEGGYGLDEYTHLLKFANMWEDNVVIYKEYSINAAKFIENNTLDFVFIDANHSYESVLEDIHAWTPKVKADGWIIGHDISYPSVTKAVNECFSNWKSCPLDIKYQNGKKSEQPDVWYVQRENYNI